MELVIAMLGAIDVVASIVLGHLMSIVGSSPAVMAAVLGMVGTLALSPFFVAAYMFVSKRTEGEEHESFVIVYGGNEPVEYQFR